MHLLVKVSLCKVLISTGGEGLTVMSAGSFPGLQKKKEIRQYAQGGWDVETLDISAYLRTARMFLGYVRALF